MTPEPELLYHYTDQNGLLGILQHKKLWATHIHFLNDTKEFWLNLEGALRQLQFRQNSPRDGYEEFMLPEIISLVKSAWMTERYVAPIYVTSFSGAGDSLGQWRGYVKDKPSFALGFDIEALKRLSASQGVRFEKCIYDQATQDDQINQVISEVLDEELDLSGFYSGEPPEFKPGAAARISQRFQYIAPLHKHDAFADEEEWRIIISTDVTPTYIKYRPGTAMLVPYVEFDLTESDLLSCLRRIIVGPCSQPEMSLYSLRGLLQATDELGVMPDLESSKAPYRYW